MTDRQQFNSCVVGCVPDVLIFSDVQFSYRAVAQMELDTMRADRAHFPKLAAVRRAVKLNRKRNRRRGQPHVLRLRFSKLVTGHVEDWSSPFGDLQPTAYRRRFCLAWIR